MPLPKFASAVLVLTALMAAGHAAAPVEEAPGQKPDRVAGTPRLQISIDSTGLAVVGQVSSVAHEAILHDTVSKSDAASRATLDLREAELTPPGWGLVTELALQASLLTRFSVTTVTPAEVSIRGVTANGEAWKAMLARLENALLPGMQLDVNVTRVEDSASFAGLCKEKFDAALRGRALEFDVGSAALGTAEYALLDKLLEIASDCPGATISILANGDGPARVEANRRLAEARAQSLVNYFTGRGMPAKRLELLPPAEDAGNRARQAAFAIRIGEGAGDAKRDSPGPMR